MGHPAEPEHDNLWVIARWSSPSGHVVNTKGMEENKGPWRGAELFARACFVSCVRAVSDPQSSGRLLLDRLVWILVRTCGFHRDSPLGGRDLHGPQN